MSYIVKMNGGYIFYPSESAITANIEYLRKQPELVNMSEESLRDLAKLRLASLEGPEAYREAAKEAFVNAYNAAKSQLTNIAQQTYGAISNAAGQVYQSAAKVVSDRNTNAGVQAYREARCDLPFRGARAMSIRYTGSPFKRNVNCDYLTTQQKEKFNEWLKESMAGPYACGSWPGGDTVGCPVQPVTGGGRRPKIRRRSKTPKRSTQKLIRRR